MTKKNSLLWQNFKKGFSFKNFGFSLIACVFGFAISGIFDYIFNLPRFVVMVITFMFSVTMYYKLLFMSEGGFDKWREKYLKL